MKKVFINDVDLVNTLFHFDVRDLDFISKYGFPADIGPDSIKAEESPKVFFSKGITGVLDIIDVWLIWRMNKDHFIDNSWIDEFLSEKYLENNDKKNVTFNNMYEWLSLRKYYKVDLVEGIDYKSDDIDEAKSSAIEEKNRCEGTKIIPWKYLFANEMYKGKIKHFNKEMEDWNMHTISNHGVSPDKISLLVGKDGALDALSIVLDCYQMRVEGSEYRLLDEFVLFCLEKRKNEYKDDDVKLR